MGLDPSTDVTAVILTHYHHDHTGGLHHFPHTRIISLREGWKESKGWKGKMMGCLPQRWPIWFRPELVEFDGPAVKSKVGCIQRSLLGWQSNFCIPELRRSPLTPATTPR